MASEKVMSEVIARAVAEATRIVIQTMAEARAERTPGRSGPKIGGPAMRVLMFDGSTQGK